jgi:CO/xanthine dehydrogenase Mo-binding subunit
MNDMSNKWIGKNTIRPDGADKVTAARSTAPTTPCPAWSGASCCAARTPMRASAPSTPSKAEALPGVKAVVTAKDIVEFPLDKSVMLGIQDMRWMCRNVMAREKALFHGHPVAAVAAISEEVAAPPAS